MKNESIISINKSENCELFLNIKWVILATSKCCTKYELNHLHVNESGAVVGTDGHRLHIYTEETESCKLTPGNYEVTSNTAKQIILKLKIDVNFPEYKNAIPNYWKHYTDKSFLCSGNVAPSLLGVTCGIVVDSQFLLDAVGFGVFYRMKDKCKVTELYYMDGRSPVVFKIESRLSVLMPCRVQ